MRINIFVVFVCILAIALFASTLVILESSGHRDGCHRWHSCPSDSGSYSCGDKGYDSECSGSNNDDEDNNDEDDSDRIDNNDKNQKDDALDLPNPDRDEKKHYEFDINDNQIVSGCSYGFYKGIDGDCKPIVSEPTFNVDVENNDENKNIKSVSNLNKPETNYEDFVYTNTDEANSFFDQRNNRTYIVADSNEILVLQDKNLVNKLAFNDIKNPVYNADEDSIYFVDRTGKLNVYDDDGIIKQIETQLKIDNLAYNPSNHYIYATNTAYGKIFIIGNQQVIRSVDTGLSKVNYLAYNPSNGYMYGVDKDFLHNIVVINGLETH